MTFCILRNICKQPGKNAASILSDFPELTLARVRAQQKRNLLQDAYTSITPPLPTPWVPRKCFSRLDNGNSTFFPCYFLFTSLQFHIVISLLISPSMRTANLLPLLPYAHIYPIFLSPHHLCCFHFALSFSAIRVLFS